MAKKEKLKKSGTGPQDDEALWKGVAESVRPLSRGKNRVFDHDENIVEKAVAKTPLSKMVKKKKPLVRADQLDEAARSVDKSRELSHGLAAGVDKRTNLRLMKGKTPIEATLDLHGHTQATGHRALDAFIDAAYDSGKRCVRVVTGKGLRVNSGEIGVLRQNVPKWLNGSRLRPKVLAFSHATPRDGGEGALYVLLKRKR